MGFLLLCVYLVTFYIRPQDWVAFTRAWPVDYIFIIPTILFGLMEKSVKDRKCVSIVSLPVYYFVLAYLMIVPISDIAQGNFPLAIEQFILVLKKICVFFMFAVVIDTPEKFKRIIKFIVILTFVLAVQGIFQSVLGYGWANQDLYQQGRYGLRVDWVGFWDGANILCVGLIIALPLALGLTFSGVNILTKMVYFIFSGVLIYGVFLTNSRGGFIAFLSIIPIFLGMKIKGKKKYLILLIILFFIPLLLKYGPSRMSEVNTKEDSAHTRTWLWEQGLNMFEDNKLFGIGKGHFKEISSTGQVAHSNFIQNLAETGLVGFFFWLGMVYLSFKGYYSILKLRKDKDDKVFFALSKALFVAYSAFTVATIFITVETEPFYMLLGLSANAVIIAKGYDDSLDVKFTRRDIRNILLAMACVYILYYLLAVKEIL